MAIKIGNYTFDGLYSSIKNLDDRSGIYAILRSNQVPYSFIDIGESSKLKTRLENHEKKSAGRRIVKQGFILRYIIVHAFTKLSEKKLSRNYAISIIPFAGKDNSN